MRSQYQLPRIAILSLMTLSICSAENIITFETLDDDYFFSSGDQNIGTYYSGLDFEPDVTALSATRFGGYDSGAFPTHSGDVAVWDASDDTITISFADAQANVGFWYTSLNPITLTAFNSGGTTLGTAPGNANTDGTTGTSDFLSINEPGISSVAITSVAGQYVLDDLEYGSGEPSTTPEPTTFYLMGAGTAALLGRRLVSRRNKAERSA